ncbi:MAG TPA: (2Fe-2S) ferredoxin domain-containing protein [Polyangiaceae bacterium]|nr:(2Fe-2S) ferredoxin domain-containing protein [Polyangiaceae bacterium]
MKRRQRYVFVCTKRRPDDHKKGSCAVHGSEELLRTLKQAAVAAKVDAKVTSSGCFDLCWVGASVAVMPDNVFLKRIELSDVERVVGALALETKAELEEALAEHVAGERDFIDPNKAG